MALPKTQLSTSSFSQIKALLFFVTPLLLRFGTCGLHSTPKVKFNFKGRRFDTILDIQYNVTSELKVYSDG